LFSDLQKSLQTEENLFTDKGRLWRNPGAGGTLAAD